MATKFLGRFAALVAVLSNRKRRRRLSRQTLDRLLDRADVPRSVTPELLTVARLAGLRLDGDGGGDEGGAAGKTEAEKAAAEKAALDEAAAKTAEGDPDEELLKGARNPDAVKKAIQAERESAKAADQKAKDAQAELEAERAKVKEYEDRDKSVQEKTEQRAADAEKTAKEATHKLLRIEVAGAKKLPASLASRLVGETKAELEADADELLKQVKEEDSVSVDGGARTATKADSPDSMIREMAGRR